MRRCIAFAVLRAVLSFAVGQKPQIEERIPADAESAMRFGDVSIQRSSIRFRLLALVLVPILGLGVLAADRGLARHHTAETARLVRADAEMTAAFSHALAVINLEIDLATGFAVGAVLGLDPAATEQVLGLYLESPVSASRGEVEAAFDQMEQTMREHGLLDLGGMTDVMATESEVDDALARMVTVGISLEEIQMLRERVRLAFSRAVALQVDSLWRRQAELPNSADLTAAIRTSDSVIDLVAATRAEAGVTARVLLPASRTPFLPDTAVEQAVAHANFQLAVVALERNLAPSLRQEFESLRSAEEWIAHDRLLAEMDEGELGPLDLSPTLEGGPKIGMSLQDLDRVLGITEFQSILADFQQTVNTQMVVESVALESAAQSDARQAILLSVSLAVFTIAGAFLTMRSILFPLQQMKERAQQISRGSLQAGKATVMPHDLEAVDAAFDDLTISLRAIERQARLLAKGDVDSAELDRTIPGPLGRSVHGSVEKLRQLNSRLDYQANHDALTGLPNRAAILARLDRNLTGSVQARTPSTIMLLDLDGFKQANDSLGHVIGDEVLCRVADRLRQRATGHLVGRLGGDEFMVIIGEELDEDASQDFARTLLEGFVEPITSSAGTVWLSVCVGVVRTGHSAWLTPSEVMQRVDVALYEGKSRGPGSLVLFDQRLHDNVLNQTSLQSRLRLALSNGELELHYQPVIGVDGAVGVEALLRWSPEGESPIPPDVFIAAAEQSELIFHIDEWVMDRACQQLVEWTAVPGLADVTVSINISGRHVANYQLPEKLAETMAKYGVQADRLILEVTETELIPSIEQSVGVLSRIRELGVKLAIDDFGTGFASVAHLRRVQFDRIKIDRAFVWALDDPTERSIANLLVSLGVDLKLEVVAEGVETAAQLAWATQAGCTHLQGYFFARPMPASEIEQAILSIREQSSTWFSPTQAVLAGP